MYTILTANQRRRPSKLIREFGVYIQKQTFIQIDELYRTREIPIISDHINKFCRRTFILHPKQEILKYMLVK